MTVVWIVLALLALQRVAELCYAARNTRRLLARGAREVGKRHYPLFIALHAAWLASIAFAALRVPHVRVEWWLLEAFALLQCFRIWVVATLGPYWTTRVLTIEGAPLVRSGPYRFLRHPNYLVVALEIAVLPLAFGEVAVAIVFSALNGALLALRLRVENTALAARRNV